MQTPNTSLTFPGSCSPREALALGAARAQGGSGMAFPWEEPGGRAEAPKCPVTSLVGGQVVLLVSLVT